MIDPVLVTAGVTSIGTFAGVLTAWLRIRGRVQVHRAHLDARSDVVRTLAHGGRLIEVDGTGIIVEVGAQPNGQPRHDG